MNCLRNDEISQPPYSHNRRPAGRRESGAVAITVAVVLAVLLMFAAMAIDVGYAMSTKTELQNIADAGALSGTRTLGRLYECNKSLTTCTGPMPASEQETYTPDPIAEAAIRAAVTGVASQNAAGGVTSISITGADIVIGRWDSDTRTLTPTLTAADAVQVTARRDGSANSPIGTFFSRIMGINTLDVSAVATAALTGLGSVAAGGLPLPVAINKSWMSTLPCNENLTFHPSSAGVCAAWHSFDDTNSYRSNASGIRNMINAMAAIPPTYVSPEVNAGTSEFDFTNGTVGSLFTSGTIKNLFDSMKVRNDNVSDFDTNSSTWTTAVPIYDDISEGCNPNGLIKVVGFTRIVITNVSGPPANTLSATVSCGVEPGRGGGGSFGTKGSIPGLVR